MATAYGNWFDQTGAETEAGGWQVFLTVSYKPNPRQRGFPNSGDGKPSAEFGHRCFQDLIAHLEAQLGVRVDYIVADQYGSMNGRYHQHSLLAAIGLDEYPRSALEGWLRKRAGWSRALHFEHGAGRYLARFISRNLQSAEWTVQVGTEVTDRCQRAVGRQVIAKSADVPRNLFHQNCTRRKR